jgi:hypothetical protein
VVRGERGDTAHGVSGRLASSSNDASSRPLRKSICVVSLPRWADDEPHDGRDNDIDRQDERQQNTQLNICPTRRPAVSQSDTMISRDKVGQYADWRNVVARLTFA